MNTRHFKNEAYQHLAEVGKALSSPARLEILELLAQAPRTVEVLATEIEQSLANTSHHLQVLKRARLVKGTREGLYITYELTGVDVARLVGQLARVGEGHLAELQKLKQDFFDGRDGLESIDLETLLNRLEAEDIVLLDVRPEFEFEAGHLPGALSIPLNQLEERLSEIPKTQKVVAYCRGPYCALSADAARRLREFGWDAQRSEVSFAEFQEHKERGEL